MCRVDIVLPSGTRGLNLAVSDTHYLFRGLIRFSGKGNSEYLDKYSVTAPGRVWGAARLSWRLASQGHRFPDQTDFDQRTRENEPEYRRSSEAARVALAEQMVWACLLIRDARLFILVLPLLCLASVAWAQEQKLRGGYALGLAFSASPDYPGAARTSARLRPVIAVRYGRLRLSSSGGSSVLNFGSGAGGGGGSGASADLFDIARIKVRGALRIANGRNSSDFDLLRGLPDVERTVLGRLSASYRVTRRLSADARLSWDMFGRGNGVTASAGLQYRLPLSRRSMWSMGTRLTWADARHMRSWFGVPASAQTALRPQYIPGAGAQNIEMNMGIIARVSPYWVMFARFGVSRLMAEAAASPLTEARVRAAAQIGIGYTCCRAN